MAQGSIAQWENGHANPPEAKRRALEQVLGPLRAKTSNAELGAENTGVFGIWLRNARTQAEMSVLELARKSDVSAVAIYNIESGKSPNPQKKTRTRLGQALSTPIPEDVAQEAAEEQAVQGLGSLVDFDPYDPDDRPNAPGVYVLYDVSDRPVYVGESNNISDRINDHKTAFWFREPIVTHAAYVGIGERTLRHQTEQILIRFLKSNAVINRQSVNRKKPPGNRPSDKGI